MSQPHNNLAGWSLKLQASFRDQEKVRQSASLLNATEENIYFKMNISEPPRVILFHGGPAPMGGRTWIFLHNVFLPFLMNIFVRLRINVSFNRLTWQVGVNKLMLKYLGSLIRFIFLHKKIQYFAEKEHKNLYIFAQNFKNEYFARKHHNFNFCIHS